MADQRPQQVFGGGPAVAGFVEPSGKACSAFVGVRERVARKHSSTILRIGITVHKRDPTSGQDLGLNQFSN
jgi:hypothetical protein